MDFLLGVLAEVARGRQVSNYLKKYLSKLFSFQSNGTLPVFLSVVFSGKFNFVLWYP